MMQQWQTFVFSPRTLRKKTRWVWDPLQSNNANLDWQFVKHFQLTILCMCSDLMQTWRLRLLSLLLSYVLKRHNKKREKNLVILLCRLPTIYCALREIKTFLYGHVSRSITWQKLFRECSGYESDLVKEKEENAFLHYNNEGFVIYLWNHLLYSFFFKFHF